MKNKVVKHLESDIRTFKREASEDRELIKSLKGKKPMKHKKDAMIKKFEEAAADHHRKEGKVFKSDRKLFKKAKAIKRSNEKAEGKISKVMREFKSGELHSGSKKGPQVKNRKQAIAIALSEARRSKKK